MYFLESNTCTSIIQLELPVKYAPIYMVQNKLGQIVLYEPTSPYLEVKVGEKLLLFCPGKTNTMDDSNYSYREIPCDLDFSKNVWSTHCKEAAHRDVRKTSKRCSINERRGHIYSIGFDIGQHFVELFEVCYHYGSASVLYSHHRLNGEAVQRAFFPPGKIILQDFAMVSDFFLLTL